MGEINAMCTKSTMHELIFRGDRSGTCTLGHLYPWALVPMGINFSDDPMN
jgi:hypothetical protein